MYKKDIKKIFVKVLDFYNRKSIIDHRIGGENNPEKKRNEKEKKKKEKKRRKEKKRKKK